MARILSGIQPSGAMHVGNYYGAVKRWAEEQDDSLYCIVDLHSLTLEIDPAELRQLTFETAVALLAAGLDPDRCVLFVQSHVHEHTELAWLLECTASYGELLRMTQFKDKGRGQQSVRAGLLTYPVLMASDILLYDTEEVPVGDDQRQHLELARNLAERFNQRYGKTFLVPRATIPKVGARVMDLQRPDQKMSKSADSPLGTILLLDEPEAIERKVKRAVTDSDPSVTYDPEKRPGVANLLELLAAATGESPEVLAGRYEGFAALKGDLAEALVEQLRPIAERARELDKDPETIARALRFGADKAAKIAAPTLARARAAIGLLAP